MRQTIEHLRNKPDHIKNRISISVASVFTLFVFMFWISNQNVFPKNSVLAQNNNENKNTATALGAVKQAFLTVFSTESEYDSGSSSIEVLPGNTPKQPYRR